MSVAGALGSVGAIGMAGAGAIKGTGQTAKGLGKMANAGMLGASGISSGRLHDRTVKSMARKMEKAQNKVAKGQERQANANGSFPSKVWGMMQELVVIDIFLIPLEVLIVTIGDHLLARLKTMATSYRRDTFYVYYLAKY